MLTAKEQRFLGLYVALPLLLVTGALLGLQSCNHRQRQEQALERELRENPEGDVARQHRETQAIIERFDAQQAEKRNQ